MIYTTRDLMSQVRNQCSEINEERLSNIQILEALNRAYDDAFDIMGRLYPDPIIKYIETYPDENGIITIPDNVWEDRIMLVEFYQNGASASTDGYRTKVAETDNLNDLGALNNITGSYPYVFSIIGRSIQIGPAKGVSKYLHRVWYADSPLPLRLDQGSIEIIDQAGNFIVLDELRNTGEGLVPVNPSNAYGKYINIVDRETGLYKCTLQVESIDGNKLTFKSTPTRSTVYNLTVSSSIPDDVKLDDIISEVSGSGTVYFKTPTTNYIVQYAVNEIQRSLGVANLSFEEGKLRELKDRVEGAWKRRPASKYKRAFSRVWSSKRYRNWT
ncbi:MAG: hypothetical protein GY920_20395 [Aliivibrio sp.]|nr:hypothetical protein [Aliivibrio sp.]MCP4322174.1 hypothetical protein [Alteromonadales bacterium]